MGNAIAPCILASSPPCPEPALPPPRLPTHRVGVREVTLMILSSPPSAVSMGCRSAYRPPPFSRSGERVTSGSVFVEGLREGLAGRLTGRLAI